MQIMVWRKRKPFDWEPVAGCGFGCFVGVDVGAIVDVAVGAMVDMGVGAIAAADGVVPHAGGECFASGAISQVGGAAVIAVVATRFWCGLKLWTGWLSLKTPHSGQPFVHTAPYGAIASVGVQQRVMQLLTIKGGVTDRIGESGSGSTVDTGERLGYKGDISEIWDRDWEDCTNNIISRHPIKRENVAWKAEVERLEHGSKWIAFLKGPAKSMTVTLKGKEYVQRSGGRAAII
ncbi:hypothetical protein FF38_02814 [Lucilia cuprina]|uniref:Uncharacterized protein n=1 Tax=Lucilia cuprina TaxID=7375 RepID=A0A0L0CP32_LUCCU|nr:hypothetical protein FF38_02814 [Lucilia cuprina]